MNKNDDKKVIPFRLKSKTMSNDSLVSVFSPLNMEYLLEHEAKSLYALMSMTSRIKSMPMRLIRAMLEVELDLNDIHELPRDCLSDAIKFLASFHDEDGTQTPTIHH